MRYVLEMLGVAVLAASGALAVGHKRLYPLSFRLSPLRDLFLGSPQSTGSLTPLTSPSRPRRSGSCARVCVPPRNSLAVADSLGLALLSVSGAQIAKQAGLPNLLAVIMHMMTGVARGVVRDVIVVLTAVLSGLDEYKTAKRGEQRAEMARQTLFNFCRSISLAEPLQGHGIPQAKSAGS